MVEESTASSGIINAVTHWTLTEIVTSLVIGIWLESSITTLLVVEKIAVIEEGFEKAETSGEATSSIAVSSELWEEHQLRQI